MATAITFTLGTNVLTLSSGITYPVRAPREQVQAMDRTAAGTLEVESLGAIIKRLTLGLRNQSSADYAALVNWFDNIAAGAANAFTYTDPDAVDHLVRWTNGFNFTEGKAGFNGSIELEVVG
jgi:hypothetical protein